MGGLSYLQLQPFDLQSNPRCSEESMCSEPSTISENHEVITIPLIRITSVDSPDDAVEDQTARSYDFRIDLIGASNHSGPFLIPSLARSKTGLESPPCESSCTPLTSLPVRVRPFSTCSAMPLGRRPTRHSIDSYRRRRRVGVMASRSVEENGPSVPHVSEAGLDVPGSDFCLRNIDNFVYCSGPRDSLLGTVVEWDEGIDTWGSDGTVRIRQDVSGN